MNIREKLVYRIKDVRSYPKQNGAVLVSVIISMISVLLIIAIGNGLANNIASQLKPMSSNKLSFLYTSNTKQSISDKDFSYLNNIPEVQSFNVSSDEKMSNVDTLLKREQHLATIGKITDFSTFKIIKGNKNALDTDNSVFINQSALWIRPSVLNSLINSSIFINGKMFIIKGLYTTNLLDGGNLPDILISATHFKNLGLHISNNMLNVNFDLKSEHSIKKLEDTIIDQYDELHSGDGGLVVLDDTVLSDSMHGLVSKITTLVVIVASISLIVSGFSISSSMYANIAIRSNEIGLRRTLGATRKNIRDQFIIEALILLVAGVFMGDIISQVAVLIMKVLGIDTYISVEEMLMVGFIPIIIDFISSISPATIAANKNITDILKSEYN